ncbi:MAG: hypothetical protein FWF81_01410 [Defluviitaleaceae bacterium]|nr:hypothetical protein [Defluviitaleaceae bacterium]
MDEKKSAFKLFYLNLSSTFISSVMAIVLAGMLFVDSENVQSGLFRLGEGLAYEGVIQIFLWSCVISGLTVVLTSDIWFGKIMLLWRAAVLMFLAVAVTALFVFVFRWFPLDVWEAWATFLAFFIIGFGGGLAVAVAKTKIDDRRFNKLLSEYKSKKKEG